MASFLSRPDPLEEISASFRVHPVTALLGPRQCGKTTLARMIAEGEPTEIFDLENPVDIQRLYAPMRVLVDQPDSKARFLLLGSASPNRVKGASESLDGRIGFVDLAGFQMKEVGATLRDRLWIRGGFPGRFWQRMMETATNGGTIIFAHFWSGISPSLGSI